LVENAPKEDASMRHLEHTTPFNFIGETNIAIGSRTAGEPFCNVPDINQPVLLGKPPTCWGVFDVIINCTTLEYPDICLTPCTKSQYLFLNIPEGKKGQHEILKAIPKALEFVGPFIRAGKKVLVHCAQGKDRSVAIALAISLQYFNESEKVLTPGATPGMFSRVLSYHSVLTDHTL
jgi:tRNA A64-2'-O-ribosylphosphate transferase